MTNLPTKFLKFWTKLNKGKKLTLGEAVTFWNNAGFSPRIKLVPCVAPSV